MPRQPEKTRATETAPTESTDQVAPTESTSTNLSADQVVGICQPILDTFATVTGAKLAKLALTDDQTNTIKSAMMATHPSTRTKVVNRLATSQTSPGATIAASLVGQVANACGTSGASRKDSVNPNVQPAIARAALLLASAAFAESVLPDGADVDQVAAIGAALVYGAGDESTRAALARVVGKLTDTLDGASTNGTRADRSNGGKRSLANLANGTKLVGTYQKKSHNATIVDGAIKVGGKVHDAPSPAAKAATGQKNVDGWTFWRVGNESLSVACGGTD